MLVAGSTGLVGGECVRQLAIEPGIAAIRALVRRQPPAGTFPAGVEIVVADFDRIEDRADRFAVDHLFCALGTTIRKAGSRPAFRRVDYDYPLGVARLALERGATHFLLVSSMGADPASRFFYSRTKGEVERAINGLGYRAVTIVRPSFLLGDRTESRPMETLGRWLGRLAPASYRSVHASTVAAALIAASREDRPGARVIDNRDLLAL